MQLIIDIDEELYNYMQTSKYDEHLSKRFDYQSKFAIKHGTPLPEGHGDLIDKDALYEQYVYADCNFDMVMEYVPIVVKADKGEGINAANN